MIIYRIAKVSDARSLAKVHFICVRHQKGGFFNKLGITFMIRYYKIILSNKHSIVLLAEDQNQKCLGFHSGTLKMEEHLIQLKKNKFSLGLAVLPQLFMNPKLIYEIIMRYLSISKLNSKHEYGVKFGARGEYWCWLPNDSNAIEAINLFNKWFNILRELDIKNVFFEVDIINKRIFSFHKKNGAEVIRDIDLLDGRKRSIMVYKL